MKRELIEKSGKEQLSKQKQCELLGINRTPFTTGPKARSPRTWKLNPAEDGITLFKGIKKWLVRYHERGHQGIDMEKPIERYRNAA